MENSDLTQVTNGIIKFANNFYNIISKEEDGNIFFSPISAHIALAMAYQGAAGETADKFAKVLHVPSQEVIARGHNKIINLLHTVENVELYTANKIYLAKDLKLKCNIKAALTESFLSEARLVNFAEREKTAEIINNWVESKTNSKIKDLILPEYLNNTTRLVLVNAIYFRGFWANSFLKRNTRIAPFYISNNDTIDCEMMQVTKNFNYCDHEELNAKILEMKYYNKNVSMIIILPNARDGIKDLESKLENVDLKTITQQMRNVEVDVSLPKFTFEATIDLEPILEKMGLGIIFTPRADFSEMSENAEDLIVSKAIQKTFIKVDEVGTVAGAATGFFCSIWDISEEIKFKADHPFIILIQARHDDVISILFYGKVLKPQNK